MIINDDVYEGLQEFFAEIATTDSGIRILHPKATARIYDEDGNRVWYICDSCIQPHFYLSEILINFNPISYIVTESGSTELVIQKIGTAEENVTVNLSTLPGTASS